MYDLLSGITVIEVSSFVASPTIGLYLAQFGAEVIRVDQIGGGQDFKRWPVTAEGHSLSWENLNRAKRSLALDFTQAEGRDLLTQLIRSVGTLVTNLPVGGFLAHDKLAEGRADLITVRVMGWPDGAIALDYTANAVVGYPALTGPVEDPAPVNHVLPAWDLLTGAYGAFALVAAIRRRELTGQGSEVRLPLTDIAMGSSANLGRVAEVLQNGHDRARLGNGVYGTIGRDFVTADGARVMIVAINERQWQGLVRALMLEAGLAALEARLGLRFTGDDGLRFTHRDTIYPLIAEAAGALTHTALAERLDAAGVTHGPYKTMLEAVTDPRLVGDNPMFAAVGGNPSGFDYPAAGAFATIPGLERLPPAPAPVLGADTHDVLTRHLSLDPETIARLIDAGIVGTSS